jgi:sec-independent protein translocase protein TatC
MVHLKIALWAGIIVTSPFWLYQIWAFAAPGLYKKERRAVVRLTLGAVLLLILGGAFAYYAVLPLGFKFFLSFGGDGIVVLPVIHEYLSLVMTLLLSFGIAFELPLFLMFLAYIGLVSSKRLSSFRPYAVIIIAALAAFLTPPDVVSQILMAVPMMGLYELSLFLIKQRERAVQRALDDEDGVSGAEGEGAGKKNGGSKKAKGGDGRKALKAVKAGKARLEKEQKKEARKRAKELKLEAQKAKKSGKG